ncbi:7-cyano-7-deazaguanine synthase [Methanobacterium petrolearium]|uniref:7-cyano-7-deazaguanine synthase n=1 Tax=Methanobacterium petrolearium TaxID=710190 RepID=UPI001AE69151|nr:7-cyano-7-deazaguanine synthase [Methanobacterium petrolearium]MBP1945772.1 putative PP-loop superfamily ATPase [Methanobacterium petrolearium]
MKIQKQELISLITRIRRDIGHKDVEVGISNLFFEKKTRNLLIITPDRPEKSVIIGKGGWVVGRLREELGVDSIHVEAYSDFIVPLYRMKLALVKLKEIITEYNYPENMPLLSLANLLEDRINNPYNVESLLQKFNYTELTTDEFHGEKVNKKSENNLEIEETGSEMESDILEIKQDKLRTVVALSGGVDSSASLIIAKILGFNPLAVTVNPGDIILPSYFQESAEKLAGKLGVEHIYLDVNMQELIDGSLEGRFHPCGRCSGIIEQTIMGFARENRIPFIIYGDLLSTGANSFQKEGEVLRINLPAVLSFKKGDVKDITNKWGVKKRHSYGCPLLGVVHKKQPHMRRFSIQRVLRETRAGVLEPGEALDQITGML